MSWLVETLLLSRTRIKDGADIDSDEYQDLLAVEQQVSKLIDLELIDSFELAIVNYVLGNKPYAELERILNVSRNTIAKYFTKICSRVSFALGGYYTDEGMIEYMEKKYGLTEEQVDKMREHMEGRYRHRIRR